MSQANPNPDLIDRRAVLEAIDNALGSFTISTSTFNFVQGLSARIAALPACPVDSTPEPQPAMDNYHDRLVAEARNWPGLSTHSKNKLLDECADALEEWRTRYHRLSVATTTSAPQPALDVAGLVAEHAAQEAVFLRWFTHTESEQASAIMALRRVASSLAAALTTLAAQLRQAESANLKLSSERNAYQRRAKEAEKALREGENDDPELDGTDFAHPAWFRGSDHSLQSFCHHVNNILDGKDDGTGENCEGPWRETRKRLLALAARLAEVEANLETEREERASAYGYARDMERAANNCPGCADARTRTDAVVAAIAKALNIGDVK